MGSEYTGVCDGVTGLCEGRDGTGVGARLQARNWGPGVLACWSVCDGCGDAEGYCLCWAGRLH
jgi:hypothetical protein